MKIFFRALLVILCFIQTVQGEDEDYEDFDLELEFAQHQKSTIENFPMQEIDHEELSEAAIEGALQVQNTEAYKSDSSGKPIYQKLKEDDQKNQTKTVLSDKETDNLNTDQLLKFSQTLPNEPQFQPIIYRQPTGRTYTEHHTTTLDRP